MKIVTLEVKTTHKPLTHSATIDNPDAISDLVYSFGGKRRDDYEKCVLETRDKMSVKLSKYDDTFMEKLGYKEYTTAESVVLDTAEFVIECIILVKANTIS